MHTVVRGSSWAVVAPNLKGHLQILLHAGADSVEGVRPNVSFPQVTAAAVAGVGAPVAAAAAAVAAVASAAAAVVAVAAGGGVPEGMCLQQKGKDLGFKTCEMGWIPAASAKAAMRCASKGDHHSNGFRLQRPLASHQFAIP